MSYIYKLENLDCANCASKVENAVRKVDGIKSCSINFFALKMNIETENEMTDDMFKKLQKTIKKVEPDIKIKAV